LRFPAQVGENPIGAPQTRLRFLQTGIRPERGAREPNGEVTICVASKFWF
jgi:hypothetical protein